MRDVRPTQWLRDEKITVEMARPLLVEGAPTRVSFERIGDPVEQRRELRVELCGAGHDGGGRYHTDAGGENRGKCVILPAIALFLAILYQCGRRPEAGCRGDPRLPEATRLTIFEVECRC